MTEREEFEKWATNHGYTVPKIWVEEPHVVLLSDAACCAWEGWQARGEQIAARLRESAKDYDEWDSRIGDALRTLADEIGGSKS